MRDVQGWTLAPEYEAENISRASRFTCFVLVNRICFYNALRRKYERLPRLAISNSTSSGELLEKRLRQSFNDAKTFTRDYETVFDGDFGDRLPFVSDDSVADWRDLVRLLDKYDFAHIDVDVIGAMYERLITPAERHRYGQHYTHPLIVDLINAFAMERADDTVLDPGCGGGTFLVGAYKKKLNLDPDKDHAELINELYGCDVLHYACHLTTINLAIRNLIDDDNFPLVHLGDFLEYSPNSFFSRQPIRLQAGGLQTGVREVRIAAGSIDAIVGNPPYINSRAIPAAHKTRYHAAARLAWPSYDWKKASDIYLYFWLHAALFASEGSRIALLTQSGWLDGEFGIPLQEWMLDHFEIVAVIESDVEPWFTDARVATCVTVLRKCANPETRANNGVRFIQLNERLSKIFSSATIEVVNSFKHELLSTNVLKTGMYRIRPVAQHVLRSDGNGEQGRYVGSRWGRHLRAPDFIHELQESHKDRLVPLGNLASIKRGITTNCDSFFLVSDITDEELSRIQSAALFREAYDVAKSRVESGTIKIVRRSDGVRFALHSVNLLPILKTARDLSFLNTERLQDKMFAVVLDDPRRSSDRLSANYVEAGEREEWHLSPSFEAIGEAKWYSLRERSVSPILFVKTMQYTPLVIWNGANLLANQRLYQIEPNEGIDPRALWAVMNSVVFAAERYASVKALGKEAAIDVEVFTAMAYRTPDIRLLSDADIDSLRQQFALLVESEAEPMIDDGLLELGLGDALDFMTRWPVCETNWPRALKNPARVEIDRICLKCIGVAATDIEGVRISLYSEVITHTRKLRLVELEAQQNRRTAQGREKPSAKEMAKSIVEQVRKSSQLPLVKIPDSFIDDGIETDLFVIPSQGKVDVSPAGLFGASVSGRIGRHNVMFRNELEAAYISLLAQTGAAGSVRVPRSEEQLAAVTARVNEHVTTWSEALREATAEMTAGEDSQRKLFAESMRILNRTA